MKLKLIALLCCIVTIPVTAANHFSKDIYLDLMQDAFEAYSDERLEDYIARVEEKGITEHGYGRVTANLGILIAHGRLTEKKDLFVRMMDIAAREFPIAHIRKGSRSGIGHDFSVKEICCCIVEVEKAGILPCGKTDEWRRSLEGMKAEEIYSVQPELGIDHASNWAVFGCASECARLMSGIGGSRAYADRYLTDQLRWFDINGMYIDPNAPMVYDYVTRLQFMAALNFGYDGPAREEIERNLLKSAIPSILMQSASGEMPYGGRSNQFLHNETVIAAVFEYYASWFKAMGDIATASRFKAAAARAAESILYWTAQKPVRHIKNRYPTETSYGCEGYAYFDKYMITMASWAYLAYRFADDNIPVAAKAERASTFVTGPEFHRCVMNAGGYTVQFDLNAQKEYDSSGLGRFQKKGASPVVALASPCSTEKPNFKLDIENDGPLAISPLWDKFEVIKAKPGVVVLSDGNAFWKNRLSRRGLKMILKGKDKVSMTLPAFAFDGESESVIKCDEKTLTVAFKGSICTWTTNGRIVDSGKIYGNRNGHLRRFDVEGSRRLVIRGRISNE